MFCASEDDSRLESGKFYRNRIVAKDIENFLDKFDEEKRKIFYDKSVRAVKDFMET